MSNEQQTLVLDTEAFLKDGNPSPPINSTRWSESDADPIADILQADAATAIVKAAEMAKIDSELAFAIGHGAKAVFITSFGQKDEVWVRTHDETGEMNCFRFDHTDPRVIWPLARQYDCFPYKTGSGGWTTNLLAPSKDNMDKGVDSPEMAVALTIIQEYGL